MKKNKKETFWAYLCSAPSLLLILLIVVFPILYTAYISFTNMNVYHWFNFSFVGLKNYKDALFVFDSGFLAALLRTILWNAISFCDGTVHRLSFDTQSSCLIRTYFCSCLAVHQIFKDRRSSTYRNSISHTFYFCRCQFCRVDTDHLTLHIQESSTTVTRVDCCICLDKSVLGVRVFQLTIYRTYNTGRYRLSIAQCITDSYHLFSYLQLIGITDLCNFNLRHGVIRNI